MNDYTLNDVENKGRQGLKNIVIKLKKNYYYFIIQQNYYGLVKLKNITSHTFT